MTEVKCFNTYVKVRTDAARMSSGQSADRIAKSLLEDLSEASLEFQEDCDRFVLHCARSNRGQREFAYRV